MSQHMTRPNKRNSSKDGEDGSNPEIAVPSPELEAILQLLQQQAQQQTWLQQLLLQQAQVQQQIQQQLL